MKLLQASILLPLAFGSPKCKNKPLVGNGVKKECDQHLTEGAHCRFSCPSEHSLMGPATTQCLCTDNDVCGWTHGNFVPQCVEWQTTWIGKKKGLSPVLKGAVVASDEISFDGGDEVSLTRSSESNSKEKHLFTDTQVFSVANDAMHAFRALVGDDEINAKNEAEMDTSKSFAVEAADKVCDPLPDAGNGGVWSCSSNNGEGSACTLSCPDGFKASDDNGVTQNCACAVDESDPIITIDLGCSWSGTPATCVPDNSYEDVCIDLSPPENGTMSCTAGSSEGSKCTFTCNDENDLIYPAKSSKRRCKCKANKGCFWTRTDNFCGPPPIEPECSAIPEVSNNYTSIICDDDNNHGSSCSWVCAADFRVNGRGRRSRCKCKRKAGIYSCGWSREFENRWCVPAPRYYRKWHRKYNKATRTDDAEWMAELEEDYAKVSVWADDTLSGKFRKKRSLTSNAREFISSL